MKKSAVLFGASGITGGLLLQELISDDNFEKIYLFNRRKLGIESEKVEEIVSDLFDLDNYNEPVKADVMYVNVGSTKAKTPDLSEYRKIDFGIPVAAARLAKRNSIEKYMVVSSLGADHNASNFYTKMKGEMQNAVLEVRLKHCYILQPSLIDSNREENRLGERLAIYAARIFNPLLVGKAKKYRSIKAETIAKAMHKLAYIDMISRVIESDEIKEIATRKV